MRRSYLYGDVSNSMSMRKRAAALRQNVKLFLIGRLARVGRSRISSAAGGQKSEIVRTAFALGEAPLRQEPHFFAITSAIALRSFFSRTGFPRTASTSDGISSESLINFAKPDIMMMG